MNVVQKKVVQSKRTSEIPKLTKLHGNTNLNNSQTTKFGIENWAKTRGALLKNTEQEKLPDVSEKSVATNPYNCNEPLNLDNKDFFDQTQTKDIKSEGSSSDDDSGCHSMPDKKPEDTLSDLFTTPKETPPSSPIPSEDLDLEITTEKIRNIFMDILESNSQVAHLVQLMPDIKKKSIPDKEIIEEIKKKSILEEELIEEIKNSILKDMQIDENLSKFLTRQVEKHDVACGKPVSQSTSLHTDLKGMGKTLDYVKNHLEDIREEINNFKGHCWDKINRKVSKTEFMAANDGLNIKLNDLECRLYKDQKMLKQEVTKCKDKIRKTEYSNIPFWPIVAFVGAYSLMMYGKTH